MKPRTCLGVQDYQAVVPLYLMGVPNNMVTKKMVPMKQKVITLNKSIDYNAGVSADDIMDESIKAMQIVKKLEAQGYRCNLNIVLGTSAGSKQFIIKVRIKSANEKLNISKLALPLVHPSMLRRLFFRFIEVYPTSQIRLLVVTEALQLQLKCERYSKVSICSQTSFVKT